jgi:hypothetical protein
MCVLAVVFVVAVVGDALASASSTPNGIAPEIGAPAACANNIAQFNRGQQALLAQIPGQVSNIYDQGIAMENQLAQGVAQSLGAANPNAADQAALQAIGAPPEQQAQVAAANQAAYGTGGAALQAMGTIPALSLEQAKTNAMAYANTLPGMISASGQQALALCQGATATPYSTPSYGSGSSSYYGQPNAAGFPKNQYVHAYHTKSGKYVSGYWRNSPTDGYPTCKVIHC